jgi:hypothetical protein
MLTDPARQLFTTCSENPHCRFNSQVGPIFHMRARMGHCRGIIPMSDSGPMLEIGFSVLKYKGQTPVLACCSRCQLKFLTPTKMMDDSYAAHEYLCKKYDSHHCTMSNGRTASSVMTSSAVRSGRIRIRVTT